VLLARLLSRRAARTASRRSSRHAIFWSASIARTAREPDALAQWLADTSGSLVTSFGKGIGADLAAIRAALTEPWSNG
jgi:transposase